MQTQSIVRADTMGRAVRGDRQFSMPAKPRFLPGLMTVPIRDGLLIEGASERQVLRGNAAMTLLPRLLPLLDGRRNLAEVGTSLPGVPAKAVHDSVALLYTRGLLEDGVAEPESASSATVDFLRRHIDVTRVNANVGQALARLSNALVAVVAIGDADAAPIRDALAASGAQRTVVHRLGEPLPEGATLVVALVEGDEAVEQLNDLDSNCAQLGIPWLRAAVDAGSHSAELGPYFLRGVTACYACYTMSRPARTAAIAHDPLLTALWANMLALDATFAVSRIAPMAGGSHVVRYDLRTWTRAKAIVPRVPGCPHCRPAPVSPSACIETAVAFEDAVAFPSRTLLDPKTHQVHYRTSNIELAKEGKRYPAAEKVALPELASLPQPTGIVGARLDVHHLAALLMYTAGLKPRQPGPVNPGKPVQRWCPTGGNLGSVELYVAAYRVAGLDASIYFYQPHEHVLARVGGIQQVLEGPSPQAVILGAGALERVGRKYGPFAYRVVNLDAGVALAQLELVARELGLRAELADDWDDARVESVAGLERMVEAVTFVARLYGE